MVGIFRRVRAAMVLASYAYVMGMAVAVVAVALNEDLGDAAPVVDDGQAS